MAVWGKAFGDKSTLTSHVKSVHLKLRDHVCDHDGCGKAFFDNSRLMSHVKAVHLKVRNDM